MKIKKIYQGSAPENKILDAYSTSNTDTYSCNYVNNMDRYSTNEVKTNKVWIDGKPIYRKCFNLGNITSGIGTKTFNHNISNISNVVFQSGFLVDSNEWIELNSVHRPDTSAGIEYDLGMLVNHTEIRITLIHDRHAYFGYVILEYTKTTD